MLYAKNHPVKGVQVALLRSFGDREGHACFEASSRLFVPSFG